MVSNGIVDVGVVLVVPQLPPPQSNNIYREKYKGVALCLGMLSTALSGTYVNFGVFTLYQDKVGFV